MTVPACCGKLFRNNKLKKTIYQCFNPVLQLSAFGGMCSIVEHKNNFVLCYGLVVFQVCVILLNLIHLSWICLAPMFKEKPNEEQLLTYQNKTKNMFEETDFITGIAQPLLVSFSTLILRVLNLALLHKNLPNIFKKIEIAKRAVDFKDINCTDYVYAKVIVSLMLVLSVPYQIFSSFDDKTGDANNEKFVIFLFNHYNNFSAVCLEVQFSYVCYILKNRFQIVNEHLKNYNRVEAFVSINSLWNSSMKDKLRRIIDLRDCHHKLCQCCDDLNKLYSIQLLIILINCTVNVLLNLYFAIYGGFTSPPVQQDEEDYTMPPVHNIVKETIWSLYYFIRFVDICLSAEKLSKEANLTRILICEILANCNDEPIKDVLWIFHAYALSREIQFTANGFFKIDLKLISSAISAGTTYLVILAQFHGQKLHAGTHK